MQHEMFPHSGLSITPEAGRTGPRLWVQKLVIWENPGKILREVPLRPGLNIIWSPDPGKMEDRPIGHGSGKTTFCRLLRYCLGEDSFAPEGQRNAIWTHFPTGHVGAEIILDGELWIVMRALGHRKRDIVIKNGSFADAFRVEHDTGIAPLRNAISSAIIGNAALLMPDGVGENGAWEAALAWTTRDQECRFGHHLDWRDSDSKSHSPVRGRSKDDLLAIVRALIGALTPEEIAESQKENAVKKILTEQGLQLGKLDWNIERTRTRLNTALNGGAAVGAELDAASLKALATRNLEKVLQIPIGGTSTDIARLRKDLDKEKGELNLLENELRNNPTLIDEIGKRISAIRAELPEAYAKSIKEENPVCPLCKVLIDEVLARGCGISKGECNLEALKANIQSKIDAIKEAEGGIAALRDKEPTLKYNIASAEQRITLLDTRVTAFDNAILDRSNAVRAAERLLDDAERYSELLAERAEVVVLIGRKDVELKTTKDTLIAHRDEASGVIANLSERFDTIMREIIHANIKGEIKLDGNGLNLKVVLGGERSTAAIDSLKVVIFDIATLTCSMEGKTHLPSFLLHDSPREADLGASIYRRLFDLMKQLEKVSEVPLFQYIVTTTTEPPEDCQTYPWLRLQIHGSPADERLMKTDL
jgi:predicted  nucleic acid-binding Zn-ribbon protein